LPHNIHRNAYAAQETSFPLFETRTRCLFCADATEIIAVAV
jgi:hypothetical protein